MTELWSPRQKRKEKSAGELLENKRRVIGGGALSPSCLLAFWLCLSNVLVGAEAAIVVS